MGFNRLEMSCPHGISKAPRADIAWATKEGALRHSAVRFRADGDQPLKAAFTRLKPGLQN